MSEFTVKGIIKRILPIEKGVSQRGNEWARQTVVVEHESGEYPKLIAFNIIGLERITNMVLCEGQQILAYLNINAREYPVDSGKFYNSIECWKVEHEGGTQGGQSSAPAPAAGAAPAARSAAAAAPPDPLGPGNNPSDPDDLPFE